MNMVTEKTKLEFASIGGVLAATGLGLLRYGLAVLLIWVGFLKFSAYGAGNIHPLVENSPLLSWGLKVMTVQSFSNLLGGIEIVLGLLIFMRCCAPLACAAGSLGAAVKFLITLTLLFSTPGVFEPGLGFPYLSMNGQFFAKDVLLLAAALWSAGEALHAAAEEPVKSTARPR